ncbi:MAG: hypothetical protein KDA25_09445, partial [Phycisphaerales bacterium]|nr:hypothetical protein [Phycisphaerales bacterium]
GLLAGPAVTSDAPGARRGGFAPDGADGAGRVQPRQWLQILRQLDLSDEQKTLVREQADAFQATQRAFQQAHGARLRELMAEARDGDNRPRDLPPDKARELRELRAKMPDVQTMQAAIWDLLDADQRQDMQSRLQAVRDRMTGRRRAQQQREADAREGMADPDAMDPRSAEPPTDGMTDGMSDGMSDRATDRASDRASDRAPRRRGDAQRRNGLDDAARRRREFLEAHRLGGAARRFGDPQPD